MAAPMTAPPLEAAPQQANPVDDAEAAKRAQVTSLALHGTLGPENPPAAPLDPRAAAIQQVTQRGADINATPGVQAYGQNQVGQQYDWAQAQRSADNAGTANLMNTINATTSNYLKEMAASAPYDQRRTQAMIEQASNDFNLRKGANEVEMGRQALARRQQAIDSAALDLKTGSAAAGSGLQTRTPDAVGQILRRPVGEVQSIMNSPVYNKIIIPLTLAAHKDNLEYANYPSQITAAVNSATYPDGTPILNEAGQPLSAQEKQDLIDVAKVQLGTVIKGYDGPGILPAAADNFQTSLDAHHGAPTSAYAGNLADAFTSQVASGQGGINLSPADLAFIKRKLGGRGSKAPSTKGGFGGGKSPKVKRGG